MVLSHALMQMAESLTPPLADPAPAAGPTGNGAGLHVVRPEPVA